MYISRQILSCICMNIQLLLVVQQEPHDNGITILFFDKSKLKIHVLTRLLSSIMFSILLAFIWVTQDRNRSNFGNLMAILLWHHEKFCKYCHIARDQNIHSWNRDCVVIESIINMKIKRFLTKSCSKHVV